MKNLSAQELNPITIQRALGKISFYEFIKMSWHVLNPDPENAFVDGKMIRLVASYLEACAKGQVRNLLINLPIRHSKSSIIAIYFNAWVWTFKPQAKFLYTTFSEGRALEDAVACRLLVKSDWYRQRWPEVQISKQSDEKGRYATTARGSRSSFGLEGPVQGSSADFIVTDDPNKPGDIYSEVIRNQTNRVYDESVWPRARNPKTACRIVMQQRLHIDDLSGHIINGQNKDKWEHLCLPAEFDTQRYQSSLGEEYNDWRVEGELLWPERFSQDDIDQLKDQLGSELAIAGQLQQLPTTASGVIFDRAYFANRIQFVENYIYRFLSWDTAGGDNGAYTSGLCGTLLPDYRLVITDCFHEKIKFPDLVIEVNKMANKYKYKLQAIIIEEKSTGGPLMDVLKRNAESQWMIPLIMGFNPTGKGKKQDRAALASVWCANGSIVLPEPNEINSMWLTPFEDEIFNYPQSPYVDIVDSFSQLILATQKYLATGLRMRTRR